MTRMRFRDVANLLIYLVERHPFVIQHIQAALAPALSMLVVEHTHVGVGPRLLTTRESPPSDACVVILHTRVGGV
jgi:hypothetical protein